MPSDIFAAFSPLQKVAETENPKRPQSPKYVSSAMANWTADKGLTVRRPAERYSRV